LWYCPTAGISNLLHCNLVPIKATHLILIHNLCQCQSFFKIISQPDSQASSPCICHRNFHLPFTTLLHYLVKLEIQNTIFPSYRSFYHMCIVFKVHVWNVLRQLQCRLAVSCASHWLQSQSVADEVDVSCARCAGAPSCLNYRLKFHEVM